MGHVRIGFLPHTKQWNSIVQSLSLFGGDADVVLKIANNTLDAIRNTYEILPYDESIIKAITYLANLAFSAKQSDQIAYLNNNGYDVDEEMSLLSLVSSAQEYISVGQGSCEINKLAKDAAMQSIIKYYENHNDGQLTLFGGETRNPFANAGTGAAFCEMARSFFAVFTDKQIKYYVEREAASSINDYRQLDNFTKTLTEQASSIADHAFEISKLMQSFAAGWFNKYAIDSAPSYDETVSFLTLSFAKMREELRREAECDGE